MPSESTSSAHPASLADPPPLASSVLKCTLCGIGQAADGEQVPRQGSNDSLCEGCLRTIAQAAVETDGITPERSTLSALVEADSDDVESETSQRWSRSQTELETEPETVRPPAPIAYASAVAQPPTTIGPQSLPVPSPRPWPSPTSGPSPSPPRSLASEQQPAEKPANPLLDVTERRVPSVGRGCLYPGSVFRGTQTSGRSAYDVEVRLLVSRRPSVHQPDDAGRIVPRIDVIRLPINLPSYRYPSAPHHFRECLPLNRADSPVLRRDHRSALWFPHRPEVSSDRARRHAPLGSVRTVSTTRNARGYDPP